MTERKGGATTPAIFIWRKCYPCKSMTWHLTTGKKNDARLCTECIKATMGGKP